MTDLPPNSNKSKGVTPPNQQKPEVQQVVLTPVKQRKKPLGKRMTEMFFGGGDARTIWGWIAYEVIIPTTKELIVDVVVQGSERAIYGESISRGRRRTGALPGQQSHMNYNGIAGSPQRVDPRNRPVLSHQARTNQDFGQIILEERVAAQTVLERMFDLVSQYEVATVADLYDLCGISSNYQDSKWGWENLAGANVRRARGGGYLLDLPSPVALS